jgi:hypothetical protein
MWARELHKNIMNDFKDPETERVMEEMVRKTLSKIIIAERP